MCGEWDPDTRCGGREPLKTWRSSDTSREDLSSEDLSLVCGLTQPQERQLLPGLCLDRQEQAQVTDRMRAQTMDDDAEAQGASHSCNCIAMHRDHTKNVYFHCVRWNAPFL